MRALSHGFEVSTGSSAMSTVISSLVYTLFGALVTVLALTRELPIGCGAECDSVVLVKYDCVRGSQQTSRCRRIAFIMSGNYLVTGYGRIQVGGN